MYFFIFLDRMPGIINTKKKALPPCAVIQNRNKENNDYDHVVIIIMMMTMSPTWCFPF